MTGRYTRAECDFITRHIPYSGHKWVAAQLNRPVAGTHRYRMLGNAVTVNVIEWIGRRVMAVAA